jgi:hypothetical protein
MHVALSNVPASSAAAGRPTAEPDRAVWRILACARAAGVEVSTAQLARVVPGCAEAEITAARERVAAAVEATDVDEITTAPGDLLAGPSVTFDEAVALGLL